MVLAITPDDPEPNSERVLLRAGQLDGRTVEVAIDELAVEVTMADSSRWRYRRSGETEQVEGRHLPVLCSEGRC